MKVRCENRNGDWKGQWDDALRAPHPFMPEETIRGCPGCNNIECLVVVCDHPDCWEPYTQGTPTADGYRTTCSKHAPETTK